MAANAIASVAATSSSPDDFAYELDPKNFGPDLVLIERGLSVIPQSVATARGKDTKLLNLTENQLNSSAHMEMFTSLHTLILDKNDLSGLSTWWTETTGPILSLNTLWFNNNRVGSADLEGFLGDVARIFPNLEYLSMMRNPCCPTFLDLTEARVEAYRRHRLYVIFKLPGLRFLDATPVTEEEHAEAIKKGQYFGAVARPSPSSGRRKSSEHDEKRAAAAAAESEYQKQRAKQKAKGKHAKSPSAFLGIGENVYDGSHSEGNRFITNEQL